MNGHSIAARGLHRMSVPCSGRTGPTGWIARARMLAAFLARAAGAAAPRTGRPQAPAEPPSAIGASDRELARLRWPDPLRAHDEARWVVAHPWGGWGP